MIRNKGFIDLNAYFKDLTKSKKIDLDSLERIKIIIPCFSGSSALFWFKYWGVKVLYKKHSDKYNSYSELFSQALAERTNISYAKYDLAIYDDYSAGNITYDFKKENYEYLSLYKILIVYFENFVHNNETKDNTIGTTLKRLKDYKKDISDYMTNLYDIWNALEYYLRYNYADKIDVQKTLADLMLKITDVFCFQILSGNFDLHCGNLLIEINNADNSFDLAPLFDNENMYQLSQEFDFDKKEHMCLNVDRLDEEQKANKYDVLKKYLKESDEFFKERFLKMYENFKNMDLEKIFTEIEDRTYYPIPYEIKSKFRKSYTNNLNNVNEVLKEVQFQR